MARRAVWETSQQAEGFTRCVKGERFAVGAGNLDLKNEIRVAPAAGMSSRSGKRLEYQTFFVSWSTFKDCSDSAQMQRNKNAHCTNLL